ncbi:hypothetical protein GCM10022198_09500 [Klugiella xanthotipulae]|uniref:Uncharacterized protein n=1 Tax=Klugiella xanthotipulae TaxID=244735 RepID=A0A543I6U3_9MICO|nr:hypothetical protein [Klugiella xanthotipulae]TQM66271.1 hypothetical protein FB466_1108 [Klugiella xanthotipulae]
MGTSTLDLTIINRRSVVVGRPVFFVYMELREDSVLLELKLLDRLNSDDPGPLSRHEASRLGLLPGDVLARLGLRDSLGREYPFRLGTGGDEHNATCIVTYGRPKGPRPGWLEIVAGAGEALVRIPLGS